MFKGPYKDGVEGRGGGGVRKMKEYRIGSWKILCDEEV